MGGHRSNTPVTITPWPTSDVTSNTRFRQTEVGYIYWNKSFDLVNVSESTDCTLIDSGYGVLFYDSDGLLIDSYGGLVAALFGDTAFMKDGLIVRLVSGSCARVGTYQGVPVSREYTIYKGQLIRYTQDQTGRLSQNVLCECAMPIGDIVYSGFDLTNRRFVVVSENRTLSFTYDVSLNFTFDGEYNHSKAIGFAEGSVILGGEGEPGKLTNVFDLIAYYDAKYVRKLPTSEDGEIVNGGYELTVAFKPIPTPSVTGVVIRVSNFPTITGDTGDTTKNAMEGRIITIPGGLWAASGNTLWRGTYQYVPPVSGVASDPELFVDVIASNTSLYMGNVGAFESTQYDPYYAVGCGIEVNFNFTVVARCGGQIRGLAGMETLEFPGSTIGDINFVSWRVDSAGQLGPPGGHPQFNVEILEWLTT